MADEETNEGENTSEVQTEDSATFRAMIARAEAAEAKLEVIETEKADAALVTQQEREAALDVIVKSRGIPELQEDLLRWVKGDITEQSVEAALQAKGLNFVAPGVENIQLPAIGEPQPLAPQTPVVVPVSTLGQQVADAASGQQSQSLQQKLDAAKTPAEVALLMEEAGAAVSYT